MGAVSTLAGATEVGRRFLVEARQFDASGQAQIVGHIEDDRGVIRPAWQIRPGDTIILHRRRQHLPASDRQDLLLRRHEDQLDRPRRAT